ncbi:F0F1 ATP synthase subunit I [Pseudomonas sp. LRF_L74]|uniref:F0F1 ATP synthase subunit I n=1 Tax=Pseudomonas sp. LRF_L74 TaxID=3369422 RepID=UPI003F5F70EC
MDSRKTHRLPIHRIPVTPVLVAQLIVALLLAAGAYAWRGPVSGYSALCAGLIAWLPNVYFALKAFRFNGARAAQNIVRSFYAGEAGKLILTAVLFALTFKVVKPLDAPMLFGTFVLTLGVGWFAPLLMRTRLSRP